MLVSRGGLADFSLHDKTVLGGVYVAGLKAERDLYVLAVALAKFDVTRLEFLT